MESGSAFVTSIACAAGAVWVGRRCLPKVRSIWWLFPATLVSIATPLAVLGISLVAHTSLGTPAYDCSWNGMDVDKCRGRDWSFLQDRLEHLTIEGKMDVKICQAFIGGILTESRSAKRADGWIRCPDDDPTVWTSVECQNVGLFRMSRCYSCGGRSDTSDDYRYSVGFSANCERGKVRFGVNIPLNSIDKCAASHSVRECRLVAWSRNGRPRLNLAPTNAENRTARKRSQVDAEHWRKNG